MNKSSIVFFLAKHRVLDYFFRQAYRCIQIFWIYVLKIIPFRQKSCTEKTIRCEHNILNKNYKSSRLGLDTPVCCNTHLYEILRDVSKCLESQKIDYFIFYGTLLGSVRHNGFIPWDTDVDICVMESQKNQCLSALKKYLPKGYSVKIIKDYWVTVSYSEKNTVHVDIYFKYLKDNNIYLKGFEDYPYPYASIFPLKKVKLYDLDLFSPNNNDSLFIFYGKKCLTSSKLMHSFFKNRKTTVFNPARIDKKYIKKSHMANKQSKTLVP